MDIKSLHRQGQSIRRIAQETGRARNTVRRVLRAKEPPRFQIPERSSCLDEFKPYVEKRYRECGLSAVRLQAELRPMGYLGSLQTLRRYVHELKQQHQRPAKATLRFETPPGEQSQVDWAYCGRFRTPAGLLFPVYAFTLVLCYSRLLYLEFTSSMKLDTLIRCHQRAFEFLGGWTRALLYDNMKQVKLSRFVFNPLFLDFANHYGFTPRTCKPFSPRTKGKVERPIRYVKDNFLNGRAFVDLDDLNAQGRHWLNETANVRMHATTQERPVDLWPKEELLALASVTPYQLFESASRQVSRESVVYFERSKYSVPPAYVGRRVAVQASPQTVRIQAGDLIIAEHRRAPKPYSSVMRPEHVEALWQLTLNRPAPPQPHWELTFNQQVPVRSLTAYEEVAP